MEEPAAKARPVVPRVNMSDAARYTLEMEVVQSPAALQLTLCTLLPTIGRGHRGKSLLFEPSHQTPLDAPPCPRPASRNGTSSSKLPMHQFLTKRMHLY